MKKYLLLFCSCLVLLPSFGQEAFFAFVDNTGGKEAQHGVADYKIQTAQKVFDALVAGQGDLRRKVPKLVMNDSELYVAWAQPEKVEIGLEELAYDVCVSFGADSLNALAALLSHELVHYYEKHDWSRHFIKENAELTTAQQLEKLEEGLKLEAQADYLGGFLAHSVGFDVHGVMPALLKKVYSEEAYDLPEDIPGYPSLQDRIAMSEGAMKRLGELLIVFETANYLELLEYFETADRYYQHILDDFQSRELYNNVGVNSLHAAIKLFTNKELPYVLPVEMDPETRLRRPGTRSSEQERKQQRNDLLVKARNYFEQSMALDTEYAPAFVNTAICYVLMNDWEEAAYWLRKAVKAAPGPKMSSDIEVIKGVIAALQEDLEGAQEWWEKASEANNHLAAINLKVIQSGALAVVSPNRGFAMRREQIDELSLDQFLRSTPPDQMVTVDESDNIIAGFYQRDNSVIYSHSLDFGKEFVSVQVVDRNFTGESMEGIRIGDTREQLLDAYGEPEQYVQLPYGEFLVFPQRQLFFRLGREAKVAGWGIYRIN
ncbi:MAG: hypothetical protein R2824_30785 [Saprospiraceae bacterium]|nr:hypothetical protein [Lewinella sp.]